jgi:hypothetical protein
MLPDQLNGIRLLIAEKQRLLEAGWDQGDSSSQVLLWTARDAAAGSTASMCAASPLGSTCRARCSRVP